MAYNANAGHDENRRPKCKLFAKRYAANGHIATTKCGVKWNPKHDAHCDYAIVHFDRNWCCDGTAYVHSESNSNTMYGYFTAACSMTGSELSDLFQQLSSDEEETPDVPSYTPGRQEERLNPSFGTNSVDLNDISIVLVSDVNDPNINIYTLAVWKPEDDTTGGVEDTLYNDSKAIELGTVTLEAGVLTISGTIFSEDDFDIAREGDMVTVTYIGGDKNVSVSSSINVDDLAVISKGDIMPNEQSQFKQALNVQNGVVAGKLDFTTYPIPATNVLNISIQSPEATTINVSVFDAQGKRVMQENNVKVNVGATNKTINTAALSAGLYFVLAEGKGIKVIKQISKQ